MGDQALGVDLTPNPIDPTTLSSREIFLFFSGELKRLERELTLKNELQEKARILQAVEWENHFSRLNNEYKRADEKARDYVQTDIYNTRHGQLESKIDLNNVAILEFRPTLNSVVSEVRTLQVWRDEITKLSHTFTTGTLPDVETLKSQGRANAVSIGDLKVKIDRAYSWGAGALAVVLVIWAVLSKFWLAR